MAIQAFGLSSAVLARVVEGSSLQQLGHRLFIASLLLVGISTLISMTRGPVQALICGSTLTVMAIAAVWDCRDSQSAIARRAG